MYYLVTLVILATTPFSWESHDGQDGKSLYDVCLKNNQKETIKKFKVTNEIFPLLQGKTFVDVWRRKDSADQVDCSMMEFNPEGSKLRVRMLNLDPKYPPLFFNELWTENKEESTINSVGTYKEEGEKDTSFTEIMQVFYVDEYVFGFFTCTMGEDYWKIAVAVWKDKINDAEAQESLRKAETTMWEMSAVLPDDKMVKLTRDICPENVQRPTI